MDTLFHISFNTNPTPSPHFNTFIYPNYPMLNIWIIFCWKALWGWISPKVSVSLQTISNCNCSSFIFTINTIPLLINVIHCAPSPISTTTKKWRIARRSYQKIFRESDINIIFNWDFITFCWWFCRKHSDLSTIIITMNINRILPTHITHHLPRKCRILEGKQSERARVNILCAYSLHISYSSYILCFNLSKAI